MNKILCTLLLVAISSSIAFGAIIKRGPHLDGRIVGGFPIDIKQVPWQASMQRNGKHACGASIISDKWLLTAAHCTGLPGMYNLTVRVGSAVCGDGGAVYQVKGFMKHKNFDHKTVDYDFALLALEESIQFNEGAKPIKMMDKPSDKEQKPSDKAQVLVTGWGATNPAFIESSGQLHGAEIHIINQNKCADAYKNRRGVTDAMLCAGLEAGGKDACQNDSGGPLVTYDGESQDAVLVGVVSWGFGCGQPNLPGVYSRVSMARDWINEKTGL